MSRFRLFTYLLCLSLLLAGCGAGVEAGPVSVAAPEVTTAATAEPVADAEDSDMDWAYDASGEAMAEVDMSEVSARVAGDPDAVRLFAVNVGKGDALILRVKDYVCLIDTGKTWAYGRLQLPLAAMGVNHSPEGKDALDAVFLTHTDDDHVGGLRWMTGESAGVLPLRAERIYAPAMYTGVKEKKHPAREAAAALTGSDAVDWLRRGDAIPLGDTGATLRVLAPATLHEDKDDNNSLVMMLESDQGRLLLTGDMELPEEAELLAFGDDLSCAALKVPNHGDDDTTSAEFARAAGARVAVVSTDGQEKPGTPDPGVVSRLRAAGSRVVVTEDSDLGILITLKGGEVAAENVVAARTAADVSIAALDTDDDRVALTARESASVGGWYLYSEKGDELFVLPDGAMIPAGGTLIVGTRSTDGAYDILWDDKKVINQKKSDAIRLYTPWGTLADRMDNGK